jgi:molybdate transport system permease protein
MLGAGGLMLLLLILPLVALAGRTLASGDPLATLFSGSVASAVRLSLITTLISMFWVVALGTPLAYAFARYRFPFKRSLYVLIQLPIVLPPVVAGLALLMAFGRRGLLGPALESVGIAIPFTPVAIVLAQIFVSAPFFIRSVQGRFASIPKEIEEAASMDGASPWAVFRRITLPLSGQALLVGLTLSWARALGEFGATILFAGNLQGRTQTMPLLVYAALERDLSAALWTGLLLVGIAAGSLALANWLSHLLTYDEEQDPLADIA